MPAVLKYHLTGGASNSDPNASLGGVHSSIELSATALNNLFDDVSVAEASSGDVEYRAIDIPNSGGDGAAATAVKQFMSVETSGPDSVIDFGIEASPIGSTLSIANESTAPTGVTFSHYNTATKLSLPDIPDGSYCRVWVRRTITAGAGNISGDQGTMTVEYA